MVYGENTPVTEPMGMTKTRAQVGAEAAETMRLGLVQVGEHLVVPTAAGRLSASALLPRVETQAWQSRGARVAQDSAGPRAIRLARRFQCAPPASAGAPTSLVGRCANHTSPTSRTNKPDDSRNTSVTAIV